MVRGCHYTVQIFEVETSAICKHILHVCKAECESELRITNLSLIEMFFKETERKRERGR